jgi:tetratricopeptide (TPR) repeat protein
METFKRDAEAALRSEPKDFVTAFDRYGRIVQFAQKAEMTRVIDAERLGVVASDAIYTMHEALVIQKLRETTSKGQQKDLATQRRIDKGMKDGTEALARAKKFRSVNEYTKAINAFSDVLQVDPDNSEAKTMLTEARQEKGKIVGVMSAQALERLKADTAAMFNQGVALKNRRTAKGYQDAINVFQNVLRKDDEGQTEWYAKANAEIAATKKKLKDLARPLRDQGKAASNKADWLAARKAYRNAVATDPFDPTLVAELDAVQVECIKSAKRQISEGKAYAAADNYSEAMTSLKLALVYADRAVDKEHQQAQELIKQIKRNTER